MGYCVFVEITDMRVKEGKEQELLDVINEELTTGDWVDAQPAGGWEDLQAAFQAWRYYARNLNGRFVVVHFDGEKLGSDEHFWSTIAPYMDDFGIVEMRGEDGAHWRWVIEDGAIKELWAHIEWC
jgi:hypothetical protein